MKTVREPVTSFDEMKDLLENLEYADTYATTNRENSLEEVANLIFSYAPMWIRSLLKVRNFMVRLAGLKAVVPEGDAPKLKEGGYVGLFKVFCLNTDEIVLGLDDKHLNFRVRIWDNTAEKYNIKVTTLVAYNNWFGRAYMTLIKPFHHLVVRRMVGQAYVVSS